MIPKAQILQYSNSYELQPTTVEKDYVLGWLLNAISNHPEFSKWIFKGGTCLKKCYFETYRFSEDLDFSIPKELEINTEIINGYLEGITSDVESQTGVTFPRKDWKIEEYSNKRGKPSFQAKISFDGPLNPQSKKSLQRIKFDLTQDEAISAEPAMQDLHHIYSDKTVPPPRIRCYSINEILAEKTRALVERNGRARDVYDAVNISRNFRSEINPEETVILAKQKFEFKQLNTPTVDFVMSAIDSDQLKANWEHQLAHQINDLPNIESYVSDLKNAIAWWLEPSLEENKLVPMPQALGVTMGRPLFPEVDPGRVLAPLDQIRRAARNRFLILVEYNGSIRLVEPYSLRYPTTGNEILHVWEVEKNGVVSDQHKSFVTERLRYIETSNKIFSPKWEIEL